MWTEANEPVELFSRLPADVIEVFSLFRTCETTTIARDGTPITWPLYPFWRPERGIVQFTTSVGLPAKAHHIRRRPEISMLFSDGTGSNLVDPPVVLVQGLARCGTEIVTDLTGHEADVEEGLRRQPAARFYGIDPVSRRLFGWYYWRWVIDVLPVRIWWWPSGNQTSQPNELMVAE